MNKFANDLIQEYKLSIIVSTTKSKYNIKDASICVRYDRFDIKLPTRMVNQRYLIKLFAGYANLQYNLVRVYIKNNEICVILDYPDYKLDQHFVEDTIRPYLYLEFVERFKNEMYGLHKSLLI